MANMKPLLFFITYNLLDLAMTLVAIPMGYGEMNIVARYIYGIGGAFLITLFKILTMLPTTLFIALLAYYLKPKYRIWLYFFSIPVAGVCVWNAMILVLS